MSTNTRQDYKLNIENYLYHYTTMSTAFEYILQHMTLRFSNFVHVNDPKENKQREIGFDFVDPDFRQYIGGYKERMNEILLNDARLVCFTEDNIDGRSTDEGGLYNRGFFKLRMWSQYGDNHRGVCLGFDRDILFETFSNMSSIKSYRGKVRYTNSVSDYWSSCMVEYKPVNRDDFSDYIIKTHIPKHRDTIFFTKALDWKDENEYRLLLLVESGMEEIYMNISKALKRIVVGIDFSDVYMESLKQLVRGQDIEIIKINITNGGIPEVIKWA